MPQTITVPGVGDLEFPDGMSDADMSAAIQRNYPQIHGQQAGTQPSFVDSALNTLKNAGVGYANFVSDSATHPVGELEKGLHLATGAIGGLGGGLAYLGKLATTGGDTDAAKAAQEGTQSALTYQPRTDAGKRLAGAIDSAMSVVPKAADAAGSFVADKSGSPALGAAVNTGIQAVPMALGLRRGFGAISDAAEASAAADAAANTPKGAPTTPAELTQQSLNNGQAAGYKLSPNLDPNASALDRWMQTISGKTLGEQNAAVANQGVTNQLAAQAVGKNPASLLTRDVLQQVRQSAIDSGYKPIEDLPGKIQADPQFVKNIQAIKTQHGDPLSGNPDVTSTSNILLGLKKGAASTDADPLTLVQRSTLPSFDPASIADQISTLRARAQDAFAAGRGSAGTAFRSQAGELEALVDRHLQDLDVPQSVLNNYRAARQLIAKTYSVEDVLNPSTGNVDAMGLGQALKNKAPLTGDLKTIADFANAAGNAAAVPKGTPLPSSIATHLGGAVLAHATHGASMVLVPAARLFASKWLNQRNTQPALLQPGSASFGQTALDAIHGNSAAFAKMYGPTSAGALTGTVPDSSPVPQQ